jgi:glycosyltransferase involved in cell wall biosynthesis
VRLRVLIVTPWFPNTATDRRYGFILNSARALEAAGHQISVLVTRPWIPSWLVGIDASWAHAYESLRPETFDLDSAPELVRYLSIPRHAFSDYADALYRLGIGRTLKRVIHERRIQLIHAHTERTAISVVRIAEECGVPAVVTLHGISSAPLLLNTSAKRNRLKAALNGAARVALVGEPLRAHFQSITGSDQNFRIVPNGFFLHGAARPERTEHRPVRFVSVADLNESKGIHLNLEALAMLDSQGLKDWTYSVIGDGPERPRLEALAHERGLVPRTLFHGALAHDRAMAAMAQGDVFVLPSYREAFGIAYVEAMACGLLAIGVEGQGPEAIMSHGRTGLLVPANDAESLCRAMRIAFDQPLHAREIAAAGQEHVREEFTWERHAEKLSAVFQEASHR